MFININYVWTHIKSFNREIKLLSKTFSFFFFLFSFFLSLFIFRFTWNVFIIKFEITLFCLILLNEYKILFFLCDFQLGMMVEDIKKSLTNSIKSADWLDGKTKDYALLKVNFDNLFLITRKSLFRCELINILPLKFLQKYWIWMILKDSM